MCGRVAVARPLHVLAQLFDAEAAAGLADSYQPSWNVAPTRPLVGLAVTATGRRVLGRYLWGFRSGRLFNARAETLASNGAFSAALDARRLAVLVDGFFEWQPADHGRRPLYLHRPDGAPLALAALWQHDQAGAASCTIVTTAAGPDLDGIHDRMPVVLGAQDLGVWLGPDRLPGARRRQILRPAPAGTVAHHPVDPRVGDVRNDAPDLVAPYDGGGEPLRLFT